MNYNNFFLKGISREETRQLLIEYKETDSLDARNKLIKGNYGLIYYIVKNEFCSDYIDIDDMISIGIVGLIKAVETFDISRNIEFSTYAGKCIKNEIRMEVRKIKGYKYNRNTVSIQDVVPNDIMSEDMVFENLIEDKHDFIADLEDSDIKENHIKIINQILDNLNERDSDILKLYYGFYGGKLYEQIYIAEKYNVNQPYISRRIKRILLEIREIIYKENGYIYLNEDKMTNIKKKTCKKGTK